MFVCDELPRLLRRVKDQQSAYRSLSDDELRGKSQEFRSRLGHGCTLDDLLPEAFALVDEAAHRALDIRFHEGQVAAGIVMHRGGIAELPYGEGKTLSILLPAYLNALLVPVHVVLLSSRRSQLAWETFQPVLDSLGLGAELLDTATSVVQQIGVRSSPVTLGAAPQFVAAYLSGRWSGNGALPTSASLSIGILDDADFLLADQAAASAATNGVPETCDQKLLRKCASLVRDFELAKDYHLVADGEGASLTDEGVRRAEKVLRIRRPSAESALPATLEYAVCAHALLKRGEHYIVLNDEVLGLYWPSGGIKHGFRFSPGLHEALQAKEGLPIQRMSSGTSMTHFQYFTLYKRLSGVSGSARAVQNELLERYGLTVREVHPHWPGRRTVLSDVVLQTRAEKLRAVAREVRSMHDSGRPVVVLSHADEAVELSLLLEAEHLRPHVSDAAANPRKWDAGAPGAVTVVAGSTDSVDFGFATRPDVVGCGGPYVAITHRHVMRRLDDFEAGRMGQRGTPCSIRFFLSVEESPLSGLDSTESQQLLATIGGSGSAPDGDAVQGWIAVAQGRAESAQADERRKQLLWDSARANQQNEYYVFMDRVLNMDNEDLLQLLGPIIPLIAVGLAAGATASSEISSRPNLVPIRNDLRALRLDAVPEVAAATTLGALESAIRCHLEARLAAAVDDGAHRSNLRSAVIVTADRVWEQHARRMLDLHNACRADSRMKVSLENAGRAEYEEEASRLFETTKVEALRGLLWCYLQLPGSGPSARP